MLQRFASAAPTDHRSTARPSQNPIGAVQLMHAGPVGTIGTRPPFSQDGAAPLVRAQPVDACAPGPPAPGAVLVADRGACTFLDKAVNAAEAGALGLVVINNSSQCLWVGGDNASDPTAAARLERVRSLWVAGADNATAAELLESDAVQRSRGFVARTLDPSAVLLLALALLTLIVAAVWSGRTFEAHLRREQQRRTGGAAALHDGDSEDTGGGAIRVLARHNAAQSNARAGRRCATHRRR